MRHLLLLILFTTTLFAGYKITYHGLKLGEIKSFDTIDKHYFKIKVTNSLARFLLRNKYMIFYNDDFVGEKNEKKTKYKKDNYQLIRLISRAMKNEIKKEERIFVKNSDNKYIDINFDNKYYYFKYTSKKRVKTEGYLEIKDNIFKMLVEEKNKIKIVKD